MSPKQIRHPHNGKDLPHAETLAPSDAESSAEPTIKQQVVEAMKDLEGGLNRLETSDDVDKLALQLLDILPESAYLISQIKKARKDHDPTKEAILITRQRSIYEEIVGELSLISGIETDEQRVTRENTEYRQRVVDKLTPEEDQSIQDDEIPGEDKPIDSDVLEKLGMLIQNEEDELVFVYPQNTFPPHIDEKWQHYIDIVGEHTKAVSGRRDGIHNDVKLITQLDMVRTLAHNNLSLAIKKFLMLDDWDLEQCRKLVIKMRDKKYPNVETAEKAVTSEQVMRLIAIVREVTV